MTQALHILRKGTSEKISLWLQ